VGAGSDGPRHGMGLARAGRSVVVCEQFEGRTCQRLESRRVAHRSPLLSRGTLGAARQEAYPLWQELESGWGRALLDQPGTIDLGDWRAHRDALAACGVPFEVLDRAETGRRFAIRLENGETGLFPARRRDRVRRPRAAGAAGCGDRRGRGAARPDAGQVDRGRGRDGLGRRIACERRRCDGRCVGAGPRGRGCDADARDRVVLRPRRAGAVGCSTRASV
jgi:hypothetical protein